MRSLLRQLVGQLLPDAGRPASQNDDAITKDRRGRSGENEGAFSILSALPGGLGTYGFAFGISEATAATGGF